MAISTSTLGPYGDVSALREALRQCRADLLAAQQALEASQTREARASCAARTDGLTGLPNRLALLQRTAQVLAQHATQERTLCMLFIDLDGFKAVNDQLGHAAGDSLLKVVGARLAHALRGEDFVCRLGGDEFVCLLADVGSEARAQAVARQLMACVAAPCRLGLRSVQVKASVGVALFPQDAHTLAALLNAADCAMLWAKACGKGLALARETPRLAGAAPPVARATAGRLLF